MFVTWLLKYDFMHVTIYVMKNTPRLRFATFLWNTSRYSGWIHKSKRKYVMNNNYGLVDC